MSVIQSEEGKFGKNVHQTSLRSSDQRIDEGSGVLEWESSNE